MWGSRDGGLVAWDFFSVLYTEKRGNQPIPGMARGHRKQIRFSVC